MAKIDYKKFIEDQFDIIDKKNKTVPFILNRVQEKYYDQILNDYGNNMEGLREIVLKARQQGMSSFILALFTVDFINIENSVSICIAHRKNDTEKLFKKVKFYLESYCEKNGWDSEEYLSTDNKGEIVNKTNGAVFYILTAGARVGGRGGTAKNILFCLSGDSRVVMWNGGTKQIKNINPGDYIVDGEGKKRKVDGISKRDNKEKFIGIRVYGDNGKLKVTPDHKILVRSGKKNAYRAVWKKAKDLTEKDYIAWPVGKADSAAKKEVTMKCVREMPSMGVSGHQMIKLDRDFGELCGWYLSGGYLANTNKSYSIGLAVHEDELDYLVELINKPNLRQLYSSFNISKRKESKAAVLSIVGKNLFHFIKKRFGEKDKKRIPYITWKYGREFQLGLVRGLFLGDGYIKNKDKIMFTSTREQLSRRFKKLMIDMRIGVSSIYYYKGGMRSGRLEQDQWQLYLSSSGNEKIRKLLSFDLPDTKTGRHLWLRCNEFNTNYSGRQRWRRGKKYYWQRIKRIQQCSAERFAYDIVLKGEPHSYLTPQGVVHNSEAAFFGDTDRITAREIIEGTSQQVPLDYGMIFVESCVLGSTLVFTEDGMLPIKEYMSDNLGFSYGQKPLMVSGRYGMKPTREFYNNGISDNRKITTTKGYTLECSYNHPILTLCNGRVNWKKSEDIKLGDYVCIQYGQDVWGEDDDVSDFSPNADKGKSGFNKLFSPKELTPDLSYFLGLLLAGGYIHKKPRSAYVVITSGDEVIHEMLPKITGLKWRRSDEYHSRCTKRSLVEFLEYLGIDIDAKAPEKKIPGRLLRASKENVAAFISGLFDGDGCARADRGNVSFISTSEDLVRTLQVVLLNFGIVSKLYKNETRGKSGGRIGKRKITHKHDTYILEIDKHYSEIFHQQVGLRLSRKDKVSAKVKNTLWYGEKVPGIADRVASLVEASGMPVSRLWNQYGISTKPFYSADSMLQKTLKKILKVTGIQDKDLMELANSNYRWEEVVNIKETKGQTYDFHIPDGHSFVSNGFISHNTANGYGNYYQKTWERSNKGESIYKPRFFGWQEFYDDAWIEKKKLEFESESMFQQEYPDDPRSAFISTGTPYFDIKALEKLLDNSPEPMTSGRLAQDGFWVT
jgi:intein/homing endonuclease